MADCAHCWHVSDIQPAVTNHRCEKCCHCGEGRCRVVTVSRPKGHGPHLPGYGGTYLTVGKPLPDGTWSDASTFVVGRNG